MSDLPAPPPGAPPDQGPPRVQSDCTSQGALDYWYAFIDSDAAAAYLKLAPQTLNNMRALGKGPPYAKIGGVGSVRYTRWQLHRWLMGDSGAPAALAP